MAVPLSAAAIAAPAQVIVGDWAARTVAENQPTKLAAIEGLGRTEKGAALHIGGWYDEERGEVRYGLGIPRLLSLLAFHDPNATVTGLDSVPADDRPAGERGAHRVLHDGRDRHVDGALRNGAAGRLVAPPGAPEGRWFFRAVAALGPLSVVALIAGWVTTEVGRQPWVVYDRMRTEAAVTGADGIPIGYATLVVSTWRSRWRRVAAAAIGAHAARHGGRRDGAR